MVSPADMPATPAEKPAPRSLPALVVEVEAEQSDAYDRRHSGAVKIFPSQVGHTFARIGVRHGDRRTETRLSPAALRLLAADFSARADLIDPPNQQAAPTAGTGA